MTTIEFFELCKHHDWYYHMSDDRKCHDAGHKSLMTIKSAMKGSNVFERIYNDFCEYINDGTGKIKKPEIKDYV